MIMKISVFIISLVAIIFAVVQIEKSNRKIKHDAILSANIQRNYLLLDVRTQLEYKQNGLSEAVLIPYNKLTKNKDSLDKLTHGDKKFPIKIHCRSGNRAETAIKTLKSMGYNNVENLRTIVGAKNYLENNPIYPAP